MELNEEESFKDTKPYRVFAYPNGFKIGVIGITSNQIKEKDFFNYGKINTNYKSIVEKYSNILKNNGVDAVILIAHMGIECTNREDFNYNNLDLISEEENNNCIADNSELGNLLNSLKKGTIDLVLAGQNHKNRKFFVNGIPVLQPEENLKYFNMAYLTFNLKDKKLISVKLEGPIPVCSHIYSNYRRCLNINANKEEMGDIVNFTFHGQNIKEDSQTVNALGIIKSKIDYASNNKIFTLLSDFEGFKGVEFKRDRFKESFLGNFFADMVLNIVDNSDFAIVNSELLEGSWMEGTDITEGSLLNMFSYPSSIVSFNISGKDLKLLIEGINLIPKGNNTLGNLFYPFSGGTMTFDRIKHKMTYFQFNDKIKNSKHCGQKIEENEIYKIATIDYLIPNFNADAKRLKGKINILDLQRYGDSGNLILKEIKKIANEKNGVIKIEEYFEQKNPRLIIIG